MAVDCDFILLLWNGKSSCSFHDIMLAKKYNKSFQIFFYSENNDFIEKSMNVINDENELFLSKKLSKAFKKYKALVGNEYFEKI